MGPRCASHRSRYVYPRPALLGPQLIRLRPADHARAKIERYRLDIQPEHRLHWQRDPHGNHVARVTFLPGQSLTALELIVELAVDIRPINPFDFFIDERVKTVPFSYPARATAPAPVPRSARRFASPDSELKRRSRNCTTMVQAELDRRGLEHVRAQRTCCSSPVHRSLRSCSIW
ncbi:MAG: hypothetical protein H7138_08845 [Myxococcales bacterium]|nr:hypothetical protein [Myxococcales bacterium]